METTNARNASWIFKESHTFNLYKCRQSGGIVACDVNEAKTDTNSEYMVQENAVKLIAWSENVTEG